MDEAHQATTPKSLTHRAICDLSSEYRIAMTGTPLQNAITDIQGMFALLHIQPWCDFETFKSVSPAIKLLVELRNAEFK